MIPGPTPTLLQERASGRLTDVLLLQQQRSCGQHPNPQRGGHGHGGPYQVDGEHGGRLVLSSRGWKEDSTGMEDVTTKWLLTRERIHGARRKQIATIYDTAVCGTCPE